MELVEVPSCFLCPISLQIMRDPVTLLTGITYDRDSIERWIFSEKHDVCPVTKQSLPDTELTPNHTLRRLIQAWCTVNASNGVERFPTPKPPVSKAQILSLLDEAKLPHSQMNALRKLKMIVSESERNRRCVEASGAIDFFASIIKNGGSNLREEEFSDGGESTSVSDEALSILCSLQISEQGLIELVSRNGDLIESLTKILRQSNYHSRAYAMLLLKSIFAVISPVRLIALKQDSIQEIVNVLRDRISYQATKAALKILATLCPWGRNRIKVVEAGAVPVLIELLLDESEKKACEMMLVVLDKLSGCAEGRAEIVGHAAGIAVVSKKIHRVSHLASERAVRILYAVSKFSASTALLQEMLQVGGVSKLCLMLQLDCGVKTKEKAKEILRLHARNWKNSPCVSPQLRASYPSS